MRKAIISTFIFVFLLSLNLVLVAGENDVIYEVGKKVTDFTLKDLDGKEYSLHKLLKKDDVKGVVFMFTSIQCPVSNACDTRYKELAAQFQEKGIVFLAINSNKTESVEAIRSEHSKRNYNFPILKDWNNVIADRFGAEFTPHTYLVDKEGTLIYKGRIDDNHRRENMVKENTLGMVVDEYLGGKDLTYTETKSNGCTIKRVN
ncbi:redoxin domain-containing protein [candidate division KSB1 bacterium]